MMIHPTCAYFVALVLALASAPVAGQISCPTGSELLVEIQSLGLELHHRLQIDVAGTDGSDFGTDGLTDLEHRFDELAAAAGLVSDEFERALLLAKVEQIRGLAYNLELVFDDPTASATLPSAINLTEGSPQLARGSADGLPANNGCTNATPVGLGSVGGDTADASNDGQASCGASYFSPDVWFRFTAPFDGIFYATTIGSSFDTVLSTHGDCPGTIANEIDCNDDAYGLWSSIRLDVGAGEEVLIRLAGAGGATGPFLFNIETDARIAGRITAADSGAPIEGTLARVFDQEGAWIASDRSDANGDYLLTGLDQGEYFVGTAYGTTNHIDELYDGIPCPGGVPNDCDPTTGDPIATTLGSMVTGIDFALDEESTISGTVTDVASGSPLFDVDVWLFSESGDFVGLSFCNQTGEYTFHELAEGNYHAVGGGFNYLYQLWDGRPCSGWDVVECDPTLGDPVVVPAAAAVTGIDFELTQKGAITGTITEAATGLPISFAHVGVRGLDGYSFVTTAGSDGTFAFGALRGGHYFVSTYTAFYLDELFDNIPCETDCDRLSGTPIEVNIGSTATGIDIDLVRLGSIQGTVSDASSALPISNVWVQIHDNAGNPLHGDSTDVLGNYYVAGLMPGDHFVVTDADAHADELYDGVPCPFGCDPTDGTPVTVQMATTATGVDFALEPTGGISGTVVDEATGEPLGGIWTELWHAQFPAPNGASTNPFGQFEFDNLPAGTYFVATSQSDAFLDELYDDFPCWGGPPGGCDPTKGSPIAVTAGAVTMGINIELMNLDNVIFIDGFETGGAGAWSSVTP